MHTDVRNKMNDTERAHDHEMTAVLDELMKYQDRRQLEFANAVQNAQKNVTTPDHAALDLFRAQRALDDLAVLKKAEVIIANMRYRNRQEASRRKEK